MNRDERDGVIRLENLCKRFGTLTAVDDLSLEIHRGEVFGFLGPNGAGKTTTLRMISGQLPPNGGTVTIDGRPLAGGGMAMRRRFGLCPQELVLWELLTCHEQLVFAAAMYGMDAATARRRAEDVLARLGLENHGRKLAARLSGGMKRRLNLALAVVHDPDIVILDEPEAGLDPQSRVLVREFIRSLAREKTVIFTTHNMDEAERLCDRVAIVDSGRLLVLDTPEKLKRSAGSGDVIEIVLPCGPAGDELVRRLTVACTDRPVKVSRLDGRLLLRTAEAAALLPSLLAGATDAGLAAGDIHLRLNSLEDVFINLTGRGLRE